MKKEKNALERQTERPRKQKASQFAASKQPDNQPDAVTRLQRSLGNRALQRLVAGGDSAAPGMVDEQVAGLISQQRGSGASLSSALQQRMETAMGSDFGAVRVHTSPQADALNQELSARAFTTGQDIFFRQGEYQPASADGQELIAHELTHVAQQSSGAVGGGSGPLTVNPPDDQFERQADEVARAVTETPAQAPLQRQEVSEDEELP